MSDQAAQEPTMEEILASIRRIISEDDAPADGDAPAADAAADPAPVEAAAPEPVAVEEPAAAPEEVLELTDRVETHGDIDVYTAEPAAPAEPESTVTLTPEPAPAPQSAAAEPPHQPEPEPFPVSEPADTTSGLVGSAAAGAAASAFGQLSAAISMPSDGRTLEDVTRELLKPLLKGWLDEHLPRIVDAAVRDEVERISRSRVR